MTPQGSAPPVPLESWQVGPWNRWAYQHVGELIPTRTVPRGAGPVLELPERPSELDELAFDPGDGTRMTVAEQLEQGWVDGLAVVHDGALVLERYRNGMTPATLHLSQSVGKSVLGLLVGVLGARGLLDPAARVSEHVPEVAGSGYAGATIGHLLDMTAAIDFVEDYAVDFWRYDVACGWHPPRAGADAGTILEFLPTIGPAPRAQGAAFHYATPNTDLLGIAAERAAGAPLPELIGRELWGPMGAERDAELTVDPAGTAAIGGGICATLRDYARLGTLVLAGGAGPGGGVVPPGWIAQLGQGDERAFARRTVPQLASGATGYRHQWWRRDGRAMARGIHGQLVSADPASGVVVAVLSSWPEATGAGPEAAQRGLVDALCAHLGADGR
jgi:CubicO group peptidase (beta-lactamase class C family)